ncbi:FadR/GntR family transcriptional regulator [Demequina sp. NBRC 110054]|uniref:FadR/GntR family transcriptional regulator n=1 Tax=Demequina sp. NBRC 110054 TaxID=1570343 RepID=UPI0009FE7E81|nr:GntR family transcriptional regulator [Demequina sp. NBRC 110054]
MSQGSDFQAVKTQRAYEMIVSQVEDAIADGSLKPGQHLPSEREMMENFSVSRPTVREALRVLESMGVIRSRHGDPRGPEILPPSADLLVRPVRRLVRTNNLNLADFLPVRMSIESVACSRAATLRSDEQLARMDAAIAVMQEVIDGDHTPEAFTRAEVQFHEAVWEAGHNGLVTLIGKVTQDLMFEMIQSKLSSATDAVELMRESRAHDAEILEAIRARDGQLAGGLAKRYILEYYGDHVSESERALLAATL